MFLFLSKGYIDRQYSGYVTKFRSGYCPFWTAFTPRKKFIIDKHLGSI